MSQNGSSYGSSYGFWPFDYLTTTVSGWAANESASVAAEVGWSAAPTIYATIPLRMSSTPTDAATAFEQAIYFLSLAARRADYENEKEAQAALILEKRFVENQYAQTSQSWLCSTTGYGCTLDGAAEVLGSAIDAINASGLNAVDAKKIKGYLSSHRYGVLWSQYGPWLGAGALGAAALYVWKRKRQK